MKRILFGCVMVSTIFFILIIEISLVNAYLAVTTQYSNNYPLQLSPGESIETFFKIQNEFEEGGQDLIIEVIPGESNIAVFTNNELIYDIPSGESISIPIKITIPKEGAEGTKYTVSALFKSIPSEKEGTVGFVINIGKSFPVIVLASPEERAIEEVPSDKTKQGFLIWIILIILMITIIMVVVILILYTLKKNKTINEEVLVDLHKS